MVFEFFIFAICTLYILIEIWLVIAFFRYKNKILSEPKDWPEITVMVAARNEEKNIAACLTSLCAMDYPSHKLNIIVGNDQSTDSTANIVDAFSKQHPQITLVNITDNDLGLKAKARVMAQLDVHAKGEYYLVTDADVRVKPSWAKYLIRHMKPETGVASGTTMVAGKGLFAEMQAMDWAHFMGMLNMISYSGVPATAVGNNMIVRTKAYEETGGYAAIRFSITEDYKLYSEVCKRGWKWDNIMIPEVLAYSDSTDGYIPLLHQRKRWLTGGKELPIYWWTLFGVFGLYYFVMPMALIYSPITAICLLLAKILLQILSVNRIYKLLGEPRPTLLSHLMYEGYLFVVTIGTAIFFLLPVKTIWKGRKY